MKLRDRSLVPMDEGKHRWRYHEAATDYWVEGRDLGDLAKRVAAHRSANGLAGGEPAAEIEEQLCARFPGMAVV